MSVIMRLDANALIANYYCCYVTVYSLKKRILSPIIIIIIIIYIYIYIYIYIIYIYYIIIACCYAVAKVYKVLYM